LIENLRLQTIALYLIIANFQQLHNTQWKLWLYQRD